MREHSLIKNILSTFNILFRPEKQATNAAKLTRARYGKDNTDPRRIEEECQRTYESNLQDSHAVADSIKNAILSTMLLIVLAYLTDHYVSIPLYSIKLLKVIGPALIFCGVWGRLGYSIATYDGDSDQEIANMYVFHLLYGLGFYFSAVVYLI